MRKRGPDRHALCGPKLCNLGFPGLLPPPHPNRKQSKTFQQRMENEHEIPLPLDGARRRGPGRCAGRSAGGRLHRHSPQVEGRRGHLRPHAGIRRRPAIERHRNSQGTGVRGNGPRRPTRSPLENEIRDRGGQRIRHAGHRRRTELEGIGRRNLLLPRLRQVSRGGPRGRRPSTGPLGASGIPARHVCRREGGRRTRLATSAWAT